VTDRRQFLKNAALGLGVLGARPLWARVALAGEPGSLDPSGLPSGTQESSLLDALPGKKPLIKRTFRPPNYETPLEYFNEAFTPNDAFFVRYHHADIPEVSAKDWRLEVGGVSVERPFTLTLEELRKDFEAVELAAICLCSGNRRGLSDPHVAGVEWGVGAMGNALWRGVRLKDVLAKAGVKKDALEVVLEGADRALVPTAPDFVKSIPAWRALDESTLLAFEMNGSPLPHWNGFPVRLVVPGWTGTYWMKHLTSVRVVNAPFKNFWMNPAYRIPKGKFAVVDRFISQETETNTPITEMVVSSLITNLRAGQQVRVGQRVEVKGIAWDGGYGMQQVEVSSDGGRTWETSELGKDLGRYAWRQWSHAFTPDRKGVRTVMAKATNRMGSSQAFDLIFNPAGYHHNVVQKLDLQVV
jgi:DMSO/TMAO reductase YedYZ molybdopterin-dependent catalytic subunit